MEPEDAAEVAGAGATSTSPAQVGDPARVNVPGCCYVPLFCPFGGGEPASLTLVTSVGVCSFLVQR